MRIVMEFAREQMEFEVAEERLVRARPLVPPPLADPVPAIRDALETPFHFPALRRALTPGDHLTVVVDELLPHVGLLLTPVLEHIVQAGVTPEQVTLLCPPSSSRQPWLEELPDELGDVRLEVHEPTDRKRLAYLTTMRDGKRLYLNRSIVEADQIIVLTGRRYDALLGYGGAAGLIYPFLGDAATLAEMNDQLQFGAANGESWPVRKQAIETAWLLGAPFFVQIIEGAGETVAHVVTGVCEASDEAERLLDARWRHTTPVAHLVVAGLSGDPARHTFADLAAAAASAARVVEAGGRIVLLTDVGVGPGSGRDCLLGADEPHEALRALRRQQTVALMPALQWAAACSHARILLRSGLGEELTESLFATPLRDAPQVQRLLDAAPTCLFIDDAHKALALPRE